MTLEKYLDGSRQYYVDGKLSGTLKEEYLTCYQEYDVVCFDFWNTLAYSAETNGASYRDPLIERGVPADEIYPFVREHLMTRRRLSYEKMAHTLCRHFEVWSRALVVRVAKRWERDNVWRWFPWMPHEVSRFRQAGARIVLVTNSTWPAWRAMHKRLEATKQCSIRSSASDRIFVSPGEWEGESVGFDRVFVSCNEGYSKPDNRVWETIEGWFPNVQKRSFLMIGDSEDDIKIPRKRGWAGLMLDNPSALRQQTAEFVKLFGGIARGGRKS